MASMLAIGVLCYRRDIYDDAIAYFKNGGGNARDRQGRILRTPGLPRSMAGIRRDQGHNTLGVALMAPICEMAWNQGDDLYGYDNNRFLAGAEYVAGTTSATTCHISFTRGEPASVVSDASSPGFRPPGEALATDVEMIVNHYVNRRGIAAPYGEQALAKLRPEGGAGGHASTFDQLAFDADVCPRAERGESAPTGFTARKCGAAIVLSGEAPQGRSITASNARPRRPDRIRPSRRT